MASPFPGLFIHVNFILEYNWVEKIQNLFKGGTTNKHDKQGGSAVASNEADGGGGGGARHSHRSACFRLRHHHSSFTFPRLICSSSVTPSIPSPSFF
jgi:hypothetical protein